MWPSSIDPVIDHFATASWQLALVVPGIVLAQFLSTIGSAERTTHPNPIGPHLKSSRPKATDADHLRPFHWN